MIFELIFKMAYIIFFTHSFTFSEKSNSTPFHNKVKLTYLNPTFKYDQKLFCFCFEQANQSSLIIMIKLLSSCPFTYHLVPKNACMCLSGARASLARTQPRQNRVSRSKMALCMTRSIVRLKSTCPRYLTAKQALLTMMIDVRILKILSNITFSLKVITSLRQTFIITK